MYLQPIQSRRSLISLVVLHLTSLKIRVSTNLANALSPQGLSWTEQAKGTAMVRSALQSVGLLATILFAGTTAVADPQENIGQVRSRFACSEPALRLYLADPPYDNYFYSDCHSSSHVLVRSPVPGGDIGNITPRLLVAWPAGNSGIALYFDPVCLLSDRANGRLAIKPHILSHFIEGSRRESARSADRLMTILRLLTSDILYCR
jgi:hypothetical protein